MKGNSADGYGSYRTELHHDVDSHAGLRGNSLDFSTMEPDSLTDQAPNPVPADGIASLTRDRDPQADHPIFPPNDKERGPKQLTRKPPAIPENAGKLTTPAENSLFGQMTVNDLNVRR
jgi:hypothetical protein